MMLSIKNAADLLPISPRTVRLGRWVLLAEADLERLIAKSQGQGGQSPLDRTQLMPSIAEESSRLPSLLDNPLCTCNGSFDHAAHKWHHHPSCSASVDERGKICGH
jgi:hypothetical protein